MVHQSIAENKYLLLKNGVGIDLQETEDSVYSDEKWLCFILNQLIVNSVKYRTEQPVLKFYTERQGNQVILCVQDNGIGIDVGDLQRIFEKGFTGQNGRNARQLLSGCRVKILCMTVLALQETADSIDHRMQYRTLHQIGVMIPGLLIVLILVCYFRRQAGRPDKGNHLERVICFLRFVPSARKMEISGDNGFDSKIE